MLSLLCHRLIIRDDLEILAKVFLAMDQDCDGVISKADFKSSFELFYSNASEDQQLLEQKRSSTYVEAVFFKCDLDSDGVLDWHDFLLTACDKAKLFTEFNLREAF